MTKLPENGAGDIQFGVLTARLITILTRRTRLSENTRLGGEPSIEAWRERKKQQALQRELLDFDESGGMEH